LRKKAMVDHIPGIAEWLGEKYATDIHRARPEVCNCTTKYKTSTLLENNSLTIQLLLQLLCDYLNTGQRAAQGQQASSQEG
jgi:hypothetical protein